MGIFKNSAGIRIHIMILGLYSMAQKVIYRRKLYNMGPDAERLYVS
jgi:hypothetical protein